LKGEDQHTGRKNVPAATWRNTNPTLTSFRSNPGLRGNTTATNRLIHGMTRTSPSDSIKCTGYLFTFFYLRIKNT